jgi:hypothetical protein
MRRVIRKTIRHSEGGLNVAADIDAVIAINTGEDATSSETVVRSSHRVVQGGAGERDQPDQPTDDPGPPEEER